MPGTTWRGARRDWRGRGNPEMGPSSYPVVWPTLSDEALLAGFATGEADAAAAFVRRFQARVYGLALTIVGDEGRAEDVAQEAFVRAWRHAATYDPRRGRVVTWLLTIARNLAIDATRLKSVEPLDPEVVATRLHGAGDAASGAAQEPSPPDERDRVRRAIGELPVEQRRPLFLAVYLGRTAREISELEGLPLGTVKTRIRTAMLRLHDSLEGDREV
jgi:RNA polymerase sigma factor (sigma-70 family)